MKDCGSLRYVTSDRWERMKRSGYTHSIEGSRFGMFLGSDGGTVLAPVVIIPTDSHYYEVWGVYEGDHDIIKTMVAGSVMAPCAVANSARAGELEGITPESAYIVERDHTSEPHTVYRT